jgi:nucleoside-diphosphate-sugar epimerase
MSIGELLISGFPGFRARAVLARALELDAVARPTLLVHPERRAEADAALEKIAHGGRAEVLEADPAAIDFGLARAEYFGLAKRITHIQHVYQVLELGAPAGAAEAVNVGGAREMIEFARVAKRLARLVHHSSIFVSGDRQGVVLETELAAKRSFRSPVARTLALAEAMLGRMPGLPLTVVRSGHVVGDTTHGLVDRLDGPYPLLVLLASSPPGTHLPLAPRSDVSVQVTPVDYVAKAALALAAMPDALGKTVHLVDPHPPTVGRLLEESAQHFGVEIDTRINPRALGRALFGNPGLSLVAQNLRGVIELITNSATYDDRVARELLEPVGLGCPSLATYLPALLTHVAARVAEKRVIEAWPKEPHHVAS